MQAIKVFKKFPSTFWIANSMELFERWAWYGFYILFAIYLTGSTDDGGLGFSQSQEGLIMGIGTAILYLLPIVTGAISDRIGYKKTLFVAYIIYTTAFLLMPVFKSYATVFIMYLYLAIGAALFKPVISATIAKTTDKDTSSIGFGIFYMMVNIGAFIGPFVTSYFRKYDWDYVFYASAAVIAFNIILLAIFYKEPAHGDRNGKIQEPLSKTLKVVFKNIGVALSDWKFVIFLVLIAGFWTMYNQLFFTLPVFIDQWGDTTIVYNFLENWWPWLAQKLGTAEGTIPAELLINVDAGFIILFQIVVSSIAMKFRPLNAMIVGILIASIGMGLTLSTQNGMYIIIAILIFSVGEMSSSPKITEYIGRIAPADKTALYMGCSFLPVAFGNFFAGFISGGVYENMSDKISLAQKEMAARGVDMPAIDNAFSKNDYLAAAAKEAGMNLNEFSQFLWDKYEPSSIWLVVAGIGFGATILLFLYDRIILKK
jgi:dipeptide/tripeptide permease